MGIVKTMDNKKKVCFGFEQLIKFYKTTQKNLSNTVWKIKAAERIVRLVQNHNEEFSSGEDLHKKYPGIGDHSIKRINEIVQDYIAMKELPTWIKWLLAAKTGAAAIKVTSGGKRLLRKKRRKTNRKRKGRATRKGPKN